MSTITVVKKNDCIAIAADSLSSLGSSKDPAEYVVNHKKILQVGESYIAICGPTSLKLVLADYFSGLNSDVSLHSVEEIFKVWKHLHIALKEEYHLNPMEDEDDSFESSRMDVLIANQHGIFGVTAHRAVQEFSRFYAYGNGREYALGAMYSSFYDECKTAKDIAQLGIQAAAEFDGSTGLPAILFSIPATASLLSPLQKHANKRQAKTTKAKEAK